STCDILWHVQGRRPPISCSPGRRSLAAHDGESGQVLLCRMGGRACALRIAQVVETMRPLPVEPVAGAPPFVLGVTLLRGAPAPVIDGGALLGSGRSQPTRFVTLRVGERRAVLAVEAVLGVRTLDG